MKDRRPAKSSSSPANSVADTLVEQVSVVDDERETVPCEQRVLDRTVHVAARWQIDDDGSERRHGYGA